MNEKIFNLTKEFHDTYERLSSEYGYETRKETRVFDRNSNNGKLMFATVNEVVRPILEENQELKKLLDYSLKLLSDIYPPCDIDGFMDKHSDYCQINCGVDEEIFKNCWLLYIEDKLKEGNK